MRTFCKKLLTGLSILAMFVGSVSALTSCGNKGEDAFIDYAHGDTVRLRLDYKNHDFFKDGVGQVEVFTYIDGDTTHFKNIYGDTTTTLKARYYGIDTPESTGNVEPWGKKASNFTHEKLANAAANGTIVVSSPFSVGENGEAGVYHAPETDSTGGRYLSLVWINETKKNCEPEELVLLNLWIVQVGLSWAKNTKEVPAFQTTFSVAAAQAEKNKLCIHSDLDDPDYNYGGFETCSLLDIKRELEIYLDDPTYVNKFSGANVRFTGVVAGFCDRNLYVQEFYPDDPDNPDGPGEWAGINIFIGMNVISSEYTKIGTYLEVVGRAVNSDTFGFQITDTQGKWPASLNPGENDCKILIPAEKNDGIHKINIFEYATPSELNSKIAQKDFESLYCRTKITTELECTKFYINDAQDEVTLTFKGCDFRVYVPFSYKGNPDDAGDIWMSEEKFIGKTFKISGVFAYHKAKSGNISYQIIICGDSDLICTVDPHGTVIADPMTPEEINNATLLPKVTYYVKGVVSSVEKITKDPSDSSKILYVNFTLNENGKKVVVTNGAGESSSLGKIIVGSSVELYGVPTKGTDIKFDAAIITIAYLHGQTQEDPLDANEANAVCNDLEVGGKTDSNYFVKGVVHSIDTPYDAASKKISFSLTSGNSIFIIQEARFTAGLNYEDLVVGVEVIVRAVLVKIDYQGTVINTTRPTGCTILYMSAI